jgi:succinate-semialdehyde dehydrogenase/glutarate-semialdehyde dehydrogenase
MIDWMADDGRRAYGRIVPGRDHDVRQIVLTEPLGVAAAFSPWNFPAYTPVRKIAGALAAGCPVILKPAEETPGTAIEIAHCFHDVGLPRGVLNLVFGVPDFVSRTLLAAPAVRKISFTGSVSVGKHLAELAARGMKRTTMELGGHSPVIVFEDADPERAADVIVPLSFAMLAKCA